jgi:trehalose 6-phosphate phosphatase
MESALEPTAWGGPVLDREHFDAVLFDLDGVLTPTATLHFRAWRELFDGWLSAQASGRDFEPFTEEDYLRFVDGRPRLDGIRSFLQSRGLQLPEGTPDDLPDAQTLWGLGKRKNALLGEELRRRGVEAYPDALRLLQRLRSAGFLLAMVTSSRNAAKILELAGLQDAFEVRVDGNLRARLELPGKPAPDTFLEAARRLGVSPERAVVLEDAESGVEAGRRGRFGLVIGVRRSGQEGSLLRAGADVEVEDLGRVTVRHGS